jgi:hypothetical protein
MAKQPASAVRGEAAWLAAKAEMAKRNNAARDRAEVQGAEQAERAAARRRAISKMEMANLPSQPSDGS